MYGAEVVNPVEKSLCYARVSDFSSVKNVEMMLKQLDSLEEYREATTIRLADYQHKVAQRYNRDVKTKDFVAVNFVLRKAVGSSRYVNAGKLAPN